METVSVDVCVIGAGSGGLSVAAGASQMGATVALVEKHRMGGDCLNYGCVPSKAMLAAAHAAQTVRRAPDFGVGAAEPKPDFAKVHAHVRHAIEAIEPNDSVERYRAMGVQVFLGAARFTGKREIRVEGGPVIKAKWFVIATGSRPAAPPIDGLDKVPYLTNESLFESAPAPGHLIVIGGGPIGIEMAQAHRRLGAAVTVLEMDRILPKDDPEAADVVRRRLLEEGVTLVEGAAVKKAAKGKEGGVSVTIEKDGKSETVEGSHLLVAAGRAPNVDGLDLEAAGVAYTKKGVTVDAGLRATGNKRVFAVGDVAGGPQFTHVAGYHAGIVIRRILLRLFWTKADHSAVPWVTYTDPELAHVGLREDQAKEKAGEIRVLRWPYAENDRAIAERETGGFAKIVTDRKGRVLGATIVGARAGELIVPWVMAVQKKMKVSAFAGLIVPYPTLSEVGKRAAGSFFTPTLFGERMKKIVRFLMRFA